ncbi:winged helix DNA-binding domain-containing protein [Isoptericola sp. NEAU-Y5]|uniref:Winged helix DNA-binding domain-containing protein n=1 Tax=Isoptericola luteus TaxID=2879484 RepID=A0ABS7ZID7_9MICO|nr:winged helix DNA-binding domain-containing protein [Isoptericola sp. NEAU-Y5]MCA5894795.1 winged helix DNA-binding domain-containing protein [Isoptericola sp. NEAU-Y5]
MPVPISDDELTRTTLARQGLLARSDDALEDVVGRVGGLQAQHADMPYVALWSRRAGQTIADLEAALTRRSVVKATLMRSTLHVVPSERWPLLDAVSGEQRAAAWRASARRAGVDLAELNAAVRAFCATPRSVDEIEEHAASLYPGTDVVGAIPGGVSRAWWRLASAAGGLVHVPPSGMWGSHAAPRYQDGTVWLADRLPLPLPQLAPDEARSLAVAGYLTAFGPASLADIARGLGIRGATAMKTALGGLDLRTYEARDGRVLYDLAGGEVVPGDTPTPVRFLPRWDQLLVAFDVRERVLDAEQAAAVYRRNADVLPTVLLDGRVAGTWASERDKDAATLRITTFVEPSAGARQEAEAEGLALLRYLEPDAPQVSVTWVEP